MKKICHKLKINSRKIFTPTVLVICGLLMLLSLFAGNLVFYAFGSDDSGYAITPVLIILLLAVIGIVLCLWLRRRIGAFVVGGYAAARGGEQLGRLCFDGDVGGSVANERSAA